MNSYKCLRNKLISCAALRNVHLSSKNTTLMKKCITTRYQKLQLYTWNYSNNLLRPNQIMKFCANNRQIGLVNDYNAYKYKDVKHSQIWVSERIATVFLMVSIPVVLLYNSQYSESGLILFTALHIHWGLEAILTDYMRSKVVGKNASIYVDTITAVITTIILFGLLWQATNGPGVINTITQLWNIDVNATYDHIYKSNN